jgi:pimeloyl-ACP methyl ester carboxylesterase
MMTGDGGRQTRLTDGVKASSPRWSPTGDRIAYVTSVKEPNIVGARVVVLPLDGSSSTTVFEFTRPDNYNAPTGIGSVDWLQDGKLLVSIVLSRMGGVGGGTVCIVDPDHPEYVFDDLCSDQIPNVPLDFRIADNGVITGTEWEPDRQRPTTRTVDERVVLLADIHSMARRVVETPGDASIDPSPSPDGEHIAYVYQGALQVVALDGSEPRRTAGVERGMAGAWSRDAHYLLYTDGATDNSEIFMIPSDGSGAPVRLSPGRDPDWQPQSLPPVLFIHGCGGALGTWTDPGWMMDATEIGEFVAGDASGKLYGAVIPGQPAILVYALDYHDSQGSIFDLAALIPQAIDKIQEETGAEKVMLVTHSMGGVLAQAYVGGLASLHGYGNDVEAAFMVAPPSRGSFLVNWLTGEAGNALACPQASELGPKSDSIARLRAADLPELDYSVVSGTRFWIPFVGLNDGVIADGDVGLSSAGYDKRQVRGIHTDVQLLPNTVSALCTTVLGEACVPELRMDEVKGLFRQRYKEDMFK